MEIEEFDKRKPDEFEKNTLLKDKHDVILISTSTKRIPIISEIFGHQIFVNGYDKYYIWKNGKFLCEGNQSDYIGKYIEERLKKSECTK